MRSLIEVYKFGHIDMKQRIANLLKYSFSVSDTDVRGGSGRRRRDRGKVAHPLALEIFHS